MSSCFFRRKAFSNANSALSSCYFFRRARFCALNSAASFSLSCSIPTTLWSWARGWLISSSLASNFFFRPETFHASTLLQFEQTGFVHWHLPLLSASGLPGGTAGFGFCTACGLRHHPMTKLSSMTGFFPHPKQRSFARTMSSMTGFWCHPFARTMSSILTHLPNSESATWLLTMMVAWPALAGAVTSH